MLAVLLLGLHPVFNFFIEHLEKVDLAGRHLGGRALDIERRGGGLATVVYLSVVGRAFVNSVGEVVVSFVGGGGS